MYTVQCTLNVYNLTYIIIITKSDINYALQLHVIRLMRHNNDVNNFCELFTPHESSDVCAVYHYSSFEVIN